MVKHDGRHEMLKQLLVSMHVSKPPEEIASSKYVYIFLIKCLFMVLGETRGFESVSEHGFFKSGTCDDSERNNCWVKELHRTMNHKIHCDDITHYPVSMESTQTG